MKKAPAHCSAKHANPQVPDADWKCPKCGAGCTPKDIRERAFVNDESADGAHSDCPLLHCGDILVCDCGYGTTGGRFAAAYRKRMALVKCPTCMGHGFVNAPKEAPE